MAEEQKGVVAAGFGLLLRRQGVLWWVFVINVVCGALGTIPAFVGMMRSMGNNLAGEKLTTGFDLGMMAELFRLPEANPMRHSTASYLFALVFMIFMLFVSGGILETYLEDRRLTKAEFFAASGAFFWRFVRLALLSIVPFVVVSMIYQGLSKAADKMGDRAIADQVGIFLSLAAFVIFMLLALWVRLWFDIAQVRAVVLNERGMWRNTWRAWRITWHDLRHLFRIYVCISFVAWVALAIGLVIWAHIPATAVPLMFVIFECIIFAYQATRLWQLSSAMIWFQRHPDAIPVAVTETTVIAEEMFEASPLPPGDPSPDLPPADA